MQPCCNLENRKVSVAQKYAETHADAQNCDGLARTQVTASFTELGSR